MGWPLLPLAGVNRARLRRILQVALSNEREPLDDVTLQPLTRPSVPIARLTPDRALIFIADGIGRIVVRAEQCLQVSLARSAPS